MMSNYDTEIVIYQSEDGHAKVDVGFEDETVWLTRQQLVDLFQTSKSNISAHKEAVSQKMKN
jgi:hypothetical protein